MGITTGVDGVGSKYIIQKINPRGWVAARDAKTNEESLINLVPLHSPGYDIDNRTVWNNIQNCCIRTTAYNWIRGFEANKDNRVVWMALLQKYEGIDL